MKKRVRYLGIELFNRKKYNKFELNNTLIKSIIQNKNNLLKKKIYFIKKLDRVGYKYSISKQRDYCMYTGRAQGIIGLTSLSRQSTKRAALINKLQNIQTNSW
jgi:hypothetical protein